MDSKEKERGCCPTEGEFLGGITGSVWPALMPLLLIPDCGQKAEEDGAVILASQGER